MKNITTHLIAILLFSLSLHAQSPGNVPTGLQLWLKADTGITLSGSDVLSWNDQSLNVITGTSDGSDDAKLISDGLNFNPIVQFTGDEFYNFGTPIALNIDPSVLAVSIISVVKTDQANGGTVISKGDDINRNFQIHFDATERVTHNVFGKSITNNAQRQGTFYTLNEPKLSSSIVNLAIVDPLLRLTPYTNGIADASATNDGVQSGTSNLSDVLIGARRETVNTGSTEYYHGDIAEVIVYNRDLTVLELQQVESYLAIKYGITLGANDKTWDTVTGTTTDLTYSGTSTNYFNALGTIVWNGPANAGYGHNVLGVARDNSAGLLQTKSTSSSIVTESILTIEGEIGSLLSDDSYLMIGSNGQDTNLSTSSVPARTASAMNRMWKVSEVSNESGLFQLEFDLNGSTITDAEAANLDLYVADDSSLDNYKNYGGIYNTGTKILTYNLINLDDGQFFTLASPEVLAGAFALEFDGIDDFIETNLDLSGLPEATIMCWVKRNNNTEILQTGIIGQPGVFGLAVLGDDLTTLFGGDIVSSLDLTQSGIGNNADEWHHIATTFKNGDVKMYFDGELVSSIVDTLGNTVLGVATTAAFSIGGNVNSILGTDNFEGQIDEVRVFNIALEDEHIQQVVYQEIQDVLGNVRGSVIPKDIKDHSLNTNVSWLSLSLYYTMNVVRGNCVVDDSSNAVNGAISGITSNTLWDQTAPMPYITTADGDWTTEATWLHGDVWDIENVPNKEWSIVEIKNDVTTLVSHTNLGLLVDSSKTLTIEGDNALKNTWYLDLNGTIDLQNDSQLIQTENSDLTVTSAGNILRRQEGQSNMFRYNYWSSPVGALSTTFNNTDYTLDMLEDIAGNVQFTSSNNPPTTSPATISTAWTFNFHNGITYYDWNTITQTTAIPAGTGYIQKGAGVGSGDYQYLFNGKPNNGDIDIIATDVGGLGSVAGTTKTDFLLGNPYASALDIHQFIIDNASTTSGEVYLWEQWAGDSHVTVEYQGGYAMVNLLDGVPAYQILGNLGGNTGSQDGTKRPSRYLAVGQGFFTEVITNGLIKFINSQRAFKKESDADGAYENGSTFFKSSTSNKNNSQPNPVVFQKIRLQFAASNALSRELVLGFSNATTDGFDYGYDAKVDEFNTNDLATAMNGDKYVIQAYSPITEDKEVDLIFNSDSNHRYTIKMLASENIIEEQPIFLWDTEENSYHDLKNDGDYHFTASTGENASRFKIVFKNRSVLSTVNGLELNSVLVYTNTIQRKLFVKGLNQGVKQIRLLNMLGQEVVNLKNVKAKTLQNGLQTSNYSTGTYVVDIVLDNGLKQSKKVIINSSQK